MNHKLAAHLSRLISCCALLFALCVAPAIHAADATRPLPNNLPPGVKPIEAGGLHNVFTIGTNLLSGSAPEDDADFAALAKLGVKNILSVDGSKPNLDLAHKHGLRYIHIPHGYDGISTNTQVQLVKAAQTAEGPTYVHCHHGLHRGPVAAAVICMNTLGWTPQQGEAWLKAAGTGSNYAGLYETVRRFHPPTAAQLAAAPAKYPEAVTPSGLVDAMVGIDARWDHLKAVRKAGYQTPKENPDIQPAHEATILWEHYREMQRLPEARQKGDDFLQRTKAAEAAAQGFEKLLRSFAANPSPASRAQLDKSFDAVAQSCSSCHKAFRDPAGIKAGK